MPFKSNTAALGRRLHAARVAGLSAAAQVVRNAVKKGLRGGYTSGDFVTGNNTASVIQTDPHRRQGTWVIAVGTSQTDPPYPVYWELGHLNIFTVNWERKEVWGPALRDNSVQAIAAYARVFRRTLAGGLAAEFGPDIASEAAD